jgi:hypothetical protein
MESVVVNEADSVGLLERASVLELVWEAPTLLDGIKDDDTVELRLGV